MGGGGSGGGAVLVVPPAEIDASNASALGERIVQAGRQHATCVVVDCADVRFCDSSGVAVLVRAQDALQECDLVVRNPPKVLRLVATLLGEAERLGIPPLPR